MRWCHEIFAKKLRVEFRNFHTSLLCHTVLIYKLFFKQLQFTNFYFTIFSVESEFIGTGECIAFEVLKYREKQEKGFFSSSTRPRTNRSSPEIKYRIGQVIRHKRWGYRAVIGKVYSLPQCEDTIFLPLRFYVKSI